MSYKLSERHKNSQHKDSSEVDLNKIASVFIIFGVLSIITSFIFTMDRSKIVEKSLHPYKNNSSKLEIGPINTKKYKESYSIKIKAALFRQSWSFVEGVVLDNNKEYLFSFGKELSSYSGYDGEGYWAEVKNNYAMNITFPKPGIYYLIFSTTGGTVPDQVKISISKKIGSGIPHLIFGILLIIMGIIINEIRNRTISILLSER